MSLSRFQRRLRVVIKRFVYSQLYLRESLLIMLGRSKPLVRFTVEPSPPSLYFNFAIKPDQVAQLERSLGLPHPLTPIQCLESEPSFHCLTLNVYRVSGLANGLRAEWSVYVRDSSGKPRYMIVEARADRGSMDPIDIITRPGRVGYEDSGESLMLEIGSDGDSRFKARCGKSGNFPIVRASPEWVEANDYIYWRNGICDRTFYDAGLANARMRMIDAASVSIENDTPWNEFIETAPRHVLVLENAIDFAMSPWWNLDTLSEEP
ncbi:MAG: hypothetical protein AAEJ52_03315 [Myxococcota bacterium]